jgi:N-succinyldiaminopimelate aminotransferase
LRGAFPLPDPARMPSTSMQRETSAPAVTGRSPFARLNDLLADIKPGKQPIMLSVGEPQHPIPNFVGDVIAAHLADFGRYPANKGSDAFRQAVAPR